MIDWLRQRRRGAEIERMNAHGLSLHQIDGRDVWVGERSVMMEGALRDNLPVLVKAARMVVRDDD